MLVKVVKLVKLGNLVKLDKLVEVVGLVKLVQLVKLVSVHCFDIWTSKSGPNLSILCTVLTWKCASRHNRVHFFNISTSKSGPNMLLRLPFWLGNVLRATTACTFSTSQLLRVVRRCCVLWILTWKCASRHNGVHFFNISTSKNGPRMVLFVHFYLEMCFAPQRRALFQHLNF